jgi:hypothetical protein
MLVANEHREKLAAYCLIKKVTQEVAANEMIGDFLQRIEQDPEMKQRMDRVKELKAALENL